jgi:hypothetical protein
MGVRFSPLTPPNVPRIPEIDLMRVIKNRKNNEILGDLDRFHDLFFTNNRKPLGEIAMK